MRNFTDQEIQAYVNTDDPLDKAGAYAIQHPQFDPVINFQGCYASVMGMPLCHLETKFAEIGWLSMARNANNLSKVSELYLPHPSTCYRWRKHWLSGKS